MLIMYLHVKANLDGNQLKSKKNEKAKQLNNYGLIEVMYQKLEKNV